MTIIQRPTDNQLETARIAFREAYSILAQAITRDLEGDPISHQLDMAQTRLRDGLDIIDPLTPPPQTSPT
jgi:hypothetical protein